MSNTSSNFDASRFQALAAKRGLSRLDVGTANMILSGRAAAPLKNFPPKVRGFVAEVRERVQRRGPTK